MYKVLINGLLLNDNFSGVQYYSENLIKALGAQGNRNFHYGVLLSNNYGGQIQQDPAISKLNCGFNTTNRLRRIYFENFKMNRYYEQNSFKLYHSTSYTLPYHWDHPSVLTIHDLIALDFPEFCNIESALYFKLFLFRSINKATHIISVSNKVKQDIINHFSIDPEKISVIYHGVNKLFSDFISPGELSSIKKRYQLPEKYILFVGNIEPKKNLERLVKAFHLLRSSTEISHKMVIVGKKGWKYKSFFETINQAGIKDEVIIKGYVHVEDLPGLYSLADVFAFPSLYEGFGIPPLEAMACGTPVLISDQGALPEISNGNCVHVNAYSIESIAKGLIELITDNNLRGQVRQNGINWVKRFNWETTAEKTQKVYEDILSHTY